LDGHRKVEIEKILPMEKADGIGRTAAYEVLDRGGQFIADEIRAAGVKE
jgi:hypothetical protein